ncbi:2-octaprenyl-3-methyl-6-methoxy-1,4-benzoquinol hydroxylase [Duganella sp. Leaf126]|uniref:2-polyprenyl-3-methyl-6-methoxy-1,4-benzoquinone monooxygenase n=1 Tax=Duganella sp. Leaf126 TaxID=1736266 RepID=UPI0006F49934|nr:2-polyprenyl-3-methyl-6-methoxy-1,4-benzoquinone monooxygenase [Duganella sp. Leaf126]KQQ33777.1 2-octaprenyl-3-methyl-6-methoxy-1,4-benzoquinol hydroxylase [Duganella sp. Leaf126]
MTSRFHHPLDRLIADADKALRVIAGVASASRPTPGQFAPDADLNEQERRHAAGLMRVNHVGEVCAQALYNAQARFARNDRIRQQFDHSSREEEDHLAWTAQRLGELGSHTSVLNPLFYAGSYALGTVAALLGDPKSLGFVVETERQVEAHLQSHLEKLPPQDVKSRAIVDQMRQDEIEHGAAAQALGAAEVPAPVKAVMSAMGKVMTSTAYYV